MSPPPAPVTASFVAAAVGVLALSTVLLLSLVEVLVQTGSETEQARKGGPVNVRPFRDLAAAQRAELAEEAQWVDRKAGLLSIPIEAAMNLVIEEIARDPATATPASAGEGSPVTASIGPSPSPATRGAGAESGANPAATPAAIPTGSVDAPR